MYRFDDDFHCVAGIELRTVSFLEAASSRFHHKLSALAADTSAPDMNE